VSETTTLPDFSADTSWRELVDLARLERWMDSKGLKGGRIVDAIRLSGGTQNVLLMFTRGDRAFVLRRPPLNPYLDGSETIRREARVLRAIGSSKTPHPRLIADCAETDVLGAAFYLMEPVEGFCAPQGLPALHRSDPAVRHAMGLSMIDGLATLHKINHREVGLQDFGRPKGFLERQVPRWLHQLESYNAYQGWSGRADLPGVETVADWLTARLPKTYEPGIIHGDFHLGNVLFSPAGPDLSAIVDWELTTIGDPRVDLGCLLATWADPEGRHPGALSVTPWAGFPSEDELIERYAAASGRDVSEANWFVVLACFKLGILQEATSARAAVGQADPAVANLLHATSIKLFERALARL
jgi:aminoglycoside phosphotransferase (APT) family kinase protein